MNQVYVKLTDGSSLTIERVISIIIKDGCYHVSTSKKVYIFTQRNVFYVKSENF